MAGFTKLVRCVEDCAGCLTKGQIYVATGEKVLAGCYEIEADDTGEKGAFFYERFEDVNVEDVTQPKPIDAHYTSFVYTLTEEDKQAGIVKVDPYFVSNQWQLGAKDNTGILFHCLKNIARFSDKNTKEREIIALFKQVKRLAELEKVNLEGQ